MALRIKPKVKEEVVKAATQVVESPVSTGERKPGAVKLSPETEERVKRIAPQVEAERLTDTEIKRTTGLDFSKGGNAVPIEAGRRGYKPEEIQEKAVEADRRMNVLTRKHTEESTAIDKAMSPDQRRDYNTLTVMGRKFKVEFDKNTLDGWGIDETTQAAYDKYLDDSVYKWYTDNLTDHENLAREGWGSSSVTGDIIKEEKANRLSTQEFSKMNIFDPESGEILNYRNASVEKLNEEYLGKGYKLYRVHPRHELEYTHYLSKVDNELVDLPAFTLPYVKGGSNAYTKDTHFVKIGRDFYDKEGNSIFHGYVKTLKADEDVRRLEKYAEEVNQFSEMWKRSKGDLAALQRELDAAHFQEFKLTSATDAQELVHTRENPKGVIDPNYKAQVLRNNEKYVYGDQGYKVEALEDFDLESSNLMQIRGNYYRHRGDEILENLNNDYGHVLDPFTMQQRNIEQAIFNNTLGRFLGDFGEWFKKQYANVIDNQNGRYNINRMSGQEVISSAIIKSPNSDYDELARAAKRAQVMYQNLINTPTKLDVWIGGKITDMLHRLPKRFWDNKYMDWLMSQKPIEWANAIVYRAYLGFFNAKQFVLQGPLQMINTLAFAPVKGMQALVSIPAVLLGHFFKDTPVFGQIPKLLAGIGGISEKEFNGFLKFMDDYGTFKQFSRRPELTQEMENFLFKKSAPQIDLIFANAGNNLSQLHADLTAYLIDGGKNMRNICRMSDDFMMNLNRVNTSMVQRSAIGKLAAQFTSYPLAAYEVMFGHHLQPWQRARFAAMQLGLWGIGGTFAKDYITNLYDFGRDIMPNVDPEILTYALEGIGTQYFAEKGTYFNEGADILGMANQFLTLVPAMNGIFGSAPELPVSGVPSVLIDNYNAVKDWIAPKTGVRDLISWADTTSKKRGVISGGKNVLRFIYAQDAKQFVDRHGDVLRRDPSEFAKWVQLIGFNSIESVIDYRAVKRDNIARDAVRKHFEESVLPFIKEMKDFKDTPQSADTADGRSLSFSYLDGKTRQAVAEAYAWVREFRPKYEDYLTSLIAKAWKSGEYKDLKRPQAQQDFVQELKEIYNQE